MVRRGFMRVAGVAAIIALALGVGTRAQQAQQAPAESGKLAVAVEYTKGAVDKDHQIWIWVFDTPNITADTTPLATGSSAENKSPYQFAGLPKEVYLAVAYDEKGGYDGTMAPPPQGTPVHIYGAAEGGVATAVPTGGDDARLEFAFDDSMRMP
jgi:uncharacterized protein (DUF2141 family)